MSAAAHLIFYVEDQANSRDFYAAALALEPRLDVPGMTEFELAQGCVLGLMPSAGIKRLLGDALPDPQQAHGVPRAELYLYVDDVAVAHRRAVQSGGRELDGPRSRDWGDEASYVLDPDGHVLAFARRVAT